MSELNLFTGTVHGDPELRYTPDGDAVARFRLRCDPVFDEALGRWCDIESGELICTTWRALAEHVTECLVDGVRVLVTGELCAMKLHGEPVANIEAVDVGISLTDRIAYTEAAWPAEHPARGPVEEPDAAAAAARPDAEEQAPAEGPRQDNVFLLAARKYLADPANFHVA